MLIPPLSRPPEASVSAAFWAPLTAALHSADNRRHCPECPDEDWTRLGVERVLHEFPSGRAFLQQHAGAWPHCPPRANYFEALKSSRRLDLLQELNPRLCQQMAEQLPDPLAQYEELANFDLYAGDGHWHGAAAHDAPIDGKKYAVGHFYLLDLRWHSLRHLALGVGKKEHDMHVLKRLELAALRQNAPKGRKVLIAWDKAGIDFPAWYRWKQSGGVYFLSQEKASMNLLVTGLPGWERADPVNAGILSDEWVAGKTAGILMRRIGYREPVSGTVYEFITNEMTLRPGILAFIYKLRWDVEKIFDILKNKLREQKAWGSSDTAKTAQAQFLCLTHNLLKLLEEKLRREGVENRAELKRKEKVLAATQELATAAGRRLPSCVVALQRLTQYSVKLLRWLRSGLAHEEAWPAALARLTQLYATL